MANDGEHISLHVTIPFNSKAAVSFPKPAGGSVTIYEGSTLVWQNGALAAKTEGMESAREDGNYIRFVVGSGDYRFGTQCAIKAETRKKLRALIRRRKHC